MKKPDDDHLYARAFARTLVAVAAAAAVIVVSTAVVNMLISLFSRSAVGTVVILLTVGIIYLINVAALKEEAEEKKATDADG
jgi:hypothetical protein